MRRRTYLAAATGTVATVAGCTELGDSGSDEESDESATADDPPELEGPDDDGTLDDFADLEPWRVVAGSVSVEDEQAAVGDRSVRLAADTDDEQARIVRTLPEPVDWSGTSPGLAVATEETITPMIQLFDDDGNVIDFRATIHGGSDLRRCNFGVSGIETDATLSEIVEIHIAYFAGSEDGRDLLFDDLHLISRPEDGLVSLQFAGGDESTYTEALPVLEEYDYPATAFVPTALVRERADHDGDHLTERQLEELADAGWTIGSHTANGQLLTDRTPDEQAAQLTDARAWLENAGYADGARYVSYPTGRYDDDSLRLVADTYDLGFAGRFPVQGEIVDPARYPRVVDPDVEDAEELLERTAELGGITTLCYYDLEGESADRFAETVALLDEFVAAGELEIVMPADLEAEHVFETE